MHFGGLAAVKSVDLRRRAGREAGPDRAQRRRQDHPLQRAHRPTEALRRARSSSKGRTSPTPSVFARTHLGMARSFQITSLFPYQSVLVNALIGLQGVAEEPVRVLPAAHEGQGAAGGGARSCSSPPTCGTSGTRSSARWPMGSSASWRSRSAWPATRSCCCWTSRVAVSPPPRARTSPRRIRDLGSKITVLMIAHDMDLVFGVAERVILLHYGADRLRGHLRRDPLQPDGQGDLHGQPQAARAAGGRSMLEVNDIHTWYGD